MSQHNDTLLKRIQKLVKENQILENQVKELAKKYDDLLIEFEDYKQLGHKPKQKDLERLKIERQEHLKFDMATVLYANIHGFSKVSKLKDSRELMDELDHILYDFDQITKSFKIQKIKTIGDTYMCAGGIPIKNITNPVEVVLAALQMQHYINELEKDKSEKLWDLTFAIHTGPVIATATGKQKISYDIKGDTVNIVTRIESSSDVGRVIVSVMTYEMIREFFDCEFYGRIPVKYKGDLDMYEVKSLRPEFAQKGSRILSNDNFKTRFLLMQFTDIQEHMLNRLEKELPDYLYYHNVKHTVDVVTQAELIGLGEGVSDEEILMLKTAALFHDAGHILGYDNHEYNSTIIAKEVLPAYNYNEKEIEEICDIIMATQLPPNPKTKLQQIMCDADLDYLGRSDFVPVSNTLYKELKHQNKMGSLNDWNKIQIMFISKHQYFTNTAKTLREVNKQMQIERIRGLIVED